MKQYYFMRKPEAIEAKDYENPDGYVQFHYSREERISKRRRDYTPSQPKLFPFMRSKKGKSSSSGKKLFYVVDVLLLIGMIYYWKNFDKFNHPSDYTEKDRIKYTLKMSPLNKEDRELFLYTENLTKKEININQNYKFTFLKVVDGKEDKNVEIKLRKININLAPGEKKQIVVHKYSFKDGEDIKWIGISVNGEFSIYKEIKNQSK